MQKYNAGTINAQMFRAAKVEEHHGNLDEHYASDRMVSVIDTLRPSSLSARQDPLGSGRSRRS